MVSSAVPISNGDFSAAQRPKWVRVSACSYLISILSISALQNAGQRAYNGSGVLWYDYLGEDSIAHLEHVEVIVSPEIGVFQEEYTMVDNWH